VLGYELYKNREAIAGGVQAIYNEMTKPGEASPEAALTADKGAKNSENVQEPAQPDENNLDKIKGNKAADAAAQEAGYKDAHDAKKGRGESKVDIYNDKATGQKWLWNGTSGSGKEQL
jgi:hypothetical protein